MDFNRLRYHFDKANVTPRVVLDIGACDGRWCREFKKLYPDCLVHQFEANKEMIDKLEGTYDILLLGDRHQDSIPYYKGGNQTGNSMYREQSVYYENCEVDYLTMHTLDEVLLNRYDNIDLAKMDVQGAEVSVMLGGLETMTKCDLFLLEISLLPYNEGAPLCAEVIAFMNEQGFMMIDILETHKFKQDLIQIDALFARKNSKYITTYFS